jgi:ornithine cyclodeaminase
MRTLQVEQIKEALSSIDLLPAIEEGFVAYSEGRAVVPPVGELILDKGEVHIKYGYIKDEEYYVIKIASGFFENPAIGLPSGDGSMLLYRQETGEFVCALFDEAYLTDVRTAVAGAIAAKYLAPKVVERIGMVGVGVQGHLQMRYLSDVTSCRNVLAHDRDESRLAKYRTDMAAEGFEVEVTSDTAQIMGTCNLIVTATPSKEPLLRVSDLRKGTHITAVGSDTPPKQELDAETLAKADLVVADSIPQCLLRGEIFKAIGAKAIEQDDVVELGNVIAGRSAGRTSDEQITVADLTGVAVQDIKIAAAVYEAAEQPSHGVSPPAVS